MTDVRFQRRRFLQIAAGVPFVGLSAQAVSAAPVARWQGVALGADAQIILAGLEREAAAPLFAQVRDEIARLEGIFSLYQPGSAVSQLNRSGRLFDPPAELLELLSLSRSVWTASVGAFDPGVQPLWQAMAMGKAAPARTGDFGDVLFSEKKIELRAGQALTLNGIAQGYITDRVADLLRGQGLTDLVVDAGEQRAVGQRSGGGPWKVGIAAPGGQLVAQLALRDRALATSSPLGSLVAPGQGHIIDPRTGLSSSRWHTVSVTHDRAAVADALSTAACCLNEAEIDEMIRQFPGAGLAYRA